MVIRIQRWSPNTCDCVVEQQVDYDEEEPQARFLMMNRVCDEHSHMKSTEFKPNHAELSANVLSLIEEAKASNLKQVNDQIDKETSRLKRKDLERCRQIVIEFNNRLDEEWAELVEPPHAFDSHIHDKIRSEQSSSK